MSTSNRKVTRAASRQCCKQQKSTLAKLQERWTLLQKEKGPGENSGKGEKVPEKVGVYLACMAHQEKT